MTPRIVRISAETAGHLDRVGEDVFDEPVDPVRLAGYLARPGNLMVVAVAGSQVVGQAMAVIHQHPDKPDDLYVDEVGVTPAWRRRGVARALMQALFDWGRELGCVSAWLATETDNEAARALYVSLGDPGETIMMFGYDLRTT